MFNSRYIKSLEAQVARYQTEITELKVSHQKEVEGFRLHISKLTDRLLAKNGIEPLKPPATNMEGINSVEDLFEDIVELEEKRKSQQTNKKEEVDDFAR